MANIKKSIFTPKELTFLKCYLNNQTLEQCYLASHPSSPSNKLNLQKQASRFLKKLKEKAGNDLIFLQFMDASDLGNLRFAKEMNARLSAKKYRNRPVQKEKEIDGQKIEFTVWEEKEEPDETVRMNATDLLATVLGKKKQTIKLEDETENPIYDEITKLTKLYNEPKPKAD